MIRVACVNHLLVALYLIGFTDVVKALRGSMVLYVRVRSNFMLLLIPRGITFKTLIVHPVALVVQALLPGSAHVDAAMHTAPKPKGLHDCMSDCRHC